MAQDTTALRVAGSTAASGSAAAVERRANIFGMTQQAEVAVLRPRDCGRWPHGLRAAMAARIAALNGEPELAGHYRTDAGDYAALADPSVDGSGQGLAEVMAFMDKVAVETRDVSAPDIASLQAAGIGDADIVRLCELNAFLAYQLRVIAGLRVLNEVYA